MNSRSCRYSARHHRGRAALTMTEVVVSTMLVAFVLVGALRGVGGVLRTWGVCERRHDGVALARQLMAEILQQAYEDPDETPEFGREPSEPSGVRSYDDVDDYDGWTASPPEHADGSALADATGWKRAVTVELVQRGEPTAIAAVDEGLKRITVTVTAPDGHVTTLQALRSRWGTLEAALPASRSVLSLVTDELEVGGMLLHGGVALPNHAEDQ